MSGPWSTRRRSGPSSGFWRGSLTSGVCACGRLRRRRVRGVVERRRSLGRPGSPSRRSGAAALEAGEPAISVDTKKKERVGDFKNGGREWRPKGQPVPVRVHDFKDAELGKAIPYGVYDLAGETGWVSVGISSDTAQFAVASIRSWWEQLGRERYPQAKHLTITADCGGSNGNRSRLWKTELQQLADHSVPEPQVCHFPPGTS